MNILIILGNKLDPNNKITDILKERLNKGYTLFSTGKYDKIIVSGGRLEKKSSRTEAYMMKHYLIDNFGIDKKNIISESRSLDTISNAKCCLIILKKIKHINSITVLSSKFHIKRSRAIFNHYLKRYKDKLKYTYSKNCIKGEKEAKRIKNEKKYLQEFLKKISSK